MYKRQVYASVSQIFDNESEFYQQSVQIAEHLFEQSNNPNIKPGELYIVHFRNCNVEEGVCDAVGIFKSETKDTFLKIVMNQNTYQLVGESGINIKKLDKACIVFNVNRDNGYKVCILDKTNTKEAIYWTTDFLGLEPAEASYFQTSNYLNLCKDFVKDIYNQENDVPVSYTHLKKIDGISNINDESDREGMRIVIDIKKDAISNVVLNTLLKHTACLLYTSAKNKTHIEFFLIKKRCW